MSKGFLTLLLLCYVSLESSLSQTGLVSQLYYGGEAASLCSSFQQ